MFIAYFDESGDDGFPAFSSPLFVMTCLYMSSDSWKENYDKTTRLRRLLKNKFGFPIKIEMHAKKFIQDKGEYHGQYPPATRRQILEHYFDLISQLEIKIINVVIDKQKAKDQGRATYHVLDNAFTYSIQRLENDMSKNHGSARFMIITDEGRIWAMRKIARRIQRINYIPSRYGFTSYRREIENLIEDPLPKSSEESHFIQLADVVSYMITLYATQNLSAVKIPWGKRVRQVLNYGDEINLLDKIANKLNTAASRKKHGIVYYPK